MSNVKLEEIKSLITMAGLSYEDIVRAISSVAAVDCQPGCDQSCVNCEQGSINGYSRAASKAFNEPFSTTTFT
jgi:hypothetical protein